MVCSDTMGERNEGMKAADSRFLSGCARLSVIGAMLLFLWPLIASIMPAADAYAPAIVNIAGIAPGERRTVVVPGRHQLFIVHRTADQIAAVRADDDAPMPSAQPDAERVQKADWLVVDGYPPVEFWAFSMMLGQNAGEPVGDFGGWFDAYSTAHYDLSGRVRKGWQVTKNLAVPDYYFLDDTTLVIE